MAAPTRAELAAEIREIARSTMDNDQVAGWFDKHSAQLCAALEAGDGWRPTHKHYKGGIYQLLCIARDSEADEADFFAIYRSEDGLTWARPLEMFDGFLPDGRRRFERLPDALPPAPATTRTALLEAVATAAKALQLSMHTVPIGWTHLQKALRALAEGGEG